MTQHRLTALAQLLRRALSATVSATASTTAGAARAATAAGTAMKLPLRRGLFTVTALGLLAWGGWKVAQHPPFVAVEPGTIAVRANTWTGSAATFAAGSVLALPGVHQVRSLSLRDQLYRPQQGRSASGEGSFQSIEGLSLGVDLTVRWAIDPARVEQAARELPPQIDRDVVEPAVQGVVYRVFSLYSVREIFSTKRREIQQAIEADLTARLRTDGLVIKGVQFGKVDLPADYRARHGPAAGRGARDRQDALHARAEGKARQAVRARGAGREGAPRNRGRGRRGRADHRREGAGRGDAPRAAVQAQADRAAQARGRGREDRAHQAGRSDRRRRGRSRRRARPRRARSSPMPRSTGSRRWARPTATRWRAKACW